MPFMLRCAQDCNVWELDNAKLADMSAIPLPAGYTGFKGCLQENMSGPSYPHGPLGYHGSKSSTAKELLPDRSKGERGALGMGYGTTHVELEKMIYYLNYVNETIGSTFQSYASGSFFPYSTARKDKDFKLIMEAQAVRDATNPNLRVCYQPSSRPRELSASLILHPPSPLWYTAQLLGCSSTKKTCTNTTTGDSFPVEQLLGKLLNGTGMF